MTAVIAALFILAAAMNAYAADAATGQSEEFRRIVPPDAKLEKLAGGFKFLEGPVWTDADGGYLIFSDIPANRLLKWTKKDGVTVYRADSRNANGNTRDLEGRLITCEHGSRSVTRTGPDGAVATLADRYEGKLLNSPNDCAVRSDGTIWFTDPPYGLAGRPAEVGGNFVFRLDPATRSLTVVARDFDMPNGLCFSPDGRKLYIADSGKPRHIRVFDVNADGTLGGGAVFCRIDKGVPDGIRCDADGRVWSSAGDGVHIYAPDGSLAGKIPVPESPANLCFGGDDGRTLFITARTSLYAIRVAVAGAALRRP